MPFVRVRVCEPAVSWTAAPFRELMNWTALVGFRVGCLPGQPDSEHGEDGLAELVLCTRCDSIHTAARAADTHTHRLLKNLRSEVPRLDLFSDSRARSRSTLVQSLDLG